MILPLQTWQHRDPKGLWPALGGLAVLAHIGVIGMSVPYLLSLREASEQTAATAIPIELSVVSLAESDQIEPLAEEIGESAAKVDQSGVEPKTATNSERPSVSSPIAQSSRGLAGLRNTAVRISAESKKSIEDEGDSARLPIVESPVSEPPPLPETTSEQQNTPADSQETSTENAVDETAEDSRSSETLETLETTEATSEDSSQPTGDSQENSIPTIGGDLLSPPPSNTEVGQSLEIRAVGAPQHVPVEDFESSPPDLIDTGYVGLLRPRAENCGAVSALATQAPLVYRIAVRLEDGTIDDANLYGSQVIAPGSDDDKAVARLIKKTGIAFSPMVVGENDKKIDDSWLMTFELSEQ